MDGREDPGHGVRSQGLRGEPACSDQWLCHLEQSAQSVVQGADGRHTRQRCAQGRWDGIRGLRDVARPQRTEKAGCSGARKGTWPGGGVAGPKLRLRAAESSAAPWGLLSRPPHGMRLADPIWAVGFLVGVAYLTGFLWVRPGSVEGLGLPTSQEYEQITYVTVWCEPLAGGFPAWRRVTRLTMASR